MPPGNQDPGFFLDSWQSKSVEAPEYEPKIKPAGKLDARIQINIDKVITKVPNTVYANNTNTYIGQMVDEPGLLGYLQDLNPHLIRFPGGNLSNVYFWDRMPGDPPENVPPADQLLNADGTQRKDEAYWYGKNRQSWTLSLDNYYKMLDKTNTSGIITINYSYARYGKGPHPVQTAAGYAADWVRYDNGRTRYWEIGNENYGQWEVGYRIDTAGNKDDQPNIINGELYGKHFTIFADSMRKAAGEVGADIKIGAQLIEQNPTESWKTEVVKNWNRRYFSAAGDTADFYIVHNYYTGQSDVQPPVILNSAYNITSDMMSWMNETISSNNAKMKPIALTEWNIFATGSQQMVSDIAGVHAAMVLGELIKYEYGMAARWDIANGWSNGNDQGMFNEGSAPGGVPKWNPRPEFYTMYYFQRFFGDRMVWSGTQGDDALVSYASTFSSGQVGLVVVNKSTSSKLFDVKVKNFDSGIRYYWYILKGGEGAFSPKIFVNGHGPEGVAGGPADYNNIKAYSAKTGEEEGIKVSIPPRAVSYILIDGQ